jgi:hypothetical protein
LTARQLAEWEAYDRAQPFGDVRADLRMGIMVANLLSPHVKEGTKLRAVDYMPFVDREVLARQDERELADNILKAFQKRG